MKLPRGEIPPELGNLGSLAFFLLDNNNLSGEIPVELGNLESLEHLSLSLNNLSGKIPAELGNLNSLRTLSLLINDLSGEIPPELGNLGNLEFLGLRRNNLSGELPPRLGDLEILRFLFVDHTDLSGSLPQTLTQLALEVFWFHSTDLCEPPGEDFQGWLAGIEDLQRTGVLCDPTLPLDLNLEVETGGSFILVDPSPTAEVPVEVRVMREGKPVEGASISVDDVNYGATDEQGVLRLRHPVAFPHGWPAEGVHSAMVTAVAADGAGGTTADLYLATRVQPKEGQICELTVTGDMIGRVQAESFVRNPANFLSPGGSPALKGIFALAKWLKTVLGLLAERSDPTLQPGDRIGFEVMRLSGVRLRPSFGIREWHHRADGEVVVQQIHWTEDGETDALLVECAFLAFEGLAGTMASPASIMIVDEDGRIVGRDPNTGAQVIDFSGFITASDETPVSFFIPMRIGERDRVEVHIIGHDHGSVDLELMMFRGHGELRTEVHRTFDVDPGKMIRFTVHPDEAGTNLEVTMQAEVVILPGSDDNPIRMGRAGLLPVGLLDFGILNVHEVDVETIRFGRGKALEPHDLTNETVLHDHISDLNGDGRKDLMLHFKVPEVGLEHSDEEVCLRATLTDGLRLLGCDRISVRHRGPTSDN